jgi:hypothetical protein
MRKCTTDKKTETQMFQPPWMDRSPTFVFNSKHHPRCRPLPFAVTVRSGFLLGDNNCNGRRLCATRICNTSTRWRKRRGVNFNGGLGAAAILVVVVPLFGGIPESVEQERGVWEAWWMVEGGRHLLRLRECTWGPEGYYCTVQYKGVEKL